MSLSQVFASRFGARTIGVCAVSAVLALSATKASAGTGSINYPPAASGVSGGASISSAGIVNLAQDVVAAFSIHFVLPSNYLRNRAVNVEVYLTAQNEPCTARIVPFSLTRFR